MNINFCYFYQIIDLYKLICLLYRIGIKKKRIKKKPKNKNDKNKTEKKKEKMIIIHLIIEACKIKIKYVA